MNTTPLLIAPLGLLLLLAACAAPAGEVSSPLPSFRLISPKPSPPSELGGRELTGTLGFDDIEGGCAFLQTPDDVRYEVLYPEGWELQRSPLRLVSPTGAVVARAGDAVTVRGAEATDMSSICQIGPIFRASEVLSP